MPKMHYCTCKVNVLGHGTQIHVFGKFNPVSWPEIGVLLQLHGENEVQDVMPFAVVDTDVFAEKARLQRTYGYAAVEAVYPGRSPNMQMLSAGHSHELPPPPLGAEEDDDFGAATQEPKRGEESKAVEEREAEDEDEAEGEAQVEGKPERAVFRPLKRSTLAQRPSE